MQGASDQTPSVVEILENPHSPVHFPGEPHPPREDTGKFLGIFRENFGFKRDKNWI